MTDQDDSVGQDRIDGLLRNEVVWADPPGDVETALMADIAGSEPLEAPSARVHAGIGRRWGLAAAIVTAAALAALLVFSPFDEDPRPGAVFALTGQGVSGEAAVGAAEAGWWIRMEISGLAPAPEGSYYEGWVSNGVENVSVGTFHMRDGDSVVLWSGVPMRDFPTLAVTRQMISGPPGPSAEVVLTGRLEG